MKNSQTKDVRRNPRHFLFQPPGGETLRDDGVVILYCRWYAAAVVDAVDVVVVVIRVLDNVSSLCSPTTRALRAPL